MSDEEAPDEDLIADKHARVLRSVVAAAMGSGQNQHTRRNHAKVTHKTLSLCPTPAAADYPLKLRIVHFIKPNQLPVMLGVTVKESEVDPELRKLVEAMPLQEGITGNVV